MSSDTRPAGTDIRAWSKRVVDLFWSIDALLLVVAYTALLLLIPTPSLKWRQRQ